MSFVDGLNWWIVETVIDTKTGEVISREKRDRGKYTKVN
jgi:hypothetical protein